MLVGYGALSMCGSIVATYITKSPANVESDVTNRHNRLRNANACQHASLSARLEAGCGLGSDELRTRPADILVFSWGTKDTAAFDITVSSPLSHKIVSETGGSAGVAAKAAESCKYENMTQSAQSLVGSAFH